MAKQWLVIASTTTTRILEEQKDVENPNRRINPFKLVKTLKNPLGRERERVFLRHKPGATFKGTGRGGISRHLMTGSRTPREDVATQFAKKVSRYLEDSLLQKKFSQLVVAAEPHFLGKLKTAFSKKLKPVVTDWIHRDLAKVGTRAIPSHLCQTPTEGMPL